MGTPGLCFPHPWRRDNGVRFAADHRKVINNYGNTLELPKNDNKYAKWSVRIKKKTWIVRSFLQQLFIGGGGGGGVTPNDDLYGEAPPERGSFLRLQATEKLVGNLSFRWVKGPKRPNIYILWLWKCRENVMVLWFVYISKTVHLQQLKGMQSSKEDMWKGCHLLIESIRKGYRFC